jgi:hypothetical protein
MAGLWKEASFLFCLTNVLGKKKGKEWRSVQKKIKFV